MRTSTKLIAAMALGAAVPLSNPSMASDDDGWRPGWGMGHMMGMGWGAGMGGCMMGFGSENMLDRIDGRLAFLKTELKINDDQAPAWDGLAQTVRSNAEVHNTMMRSMMEQMHDGAFLKKPLPDRLAIHETHMETRLQQIKAVRESVQKLYEVLDDKQKTSADELVLPMMGMGCGFGRGRMMGRGMMWSQ